MQQLHKYGVVAEIKQMLRVSEDLVKVLVEGKSRARLVDLESDGDFLIAQVRTSQLRGIRSADPVELEALMRSLHDVFENYLKLTPRLPKDVYSTFLQQKTPYFWQSISQQTCCLNIRTNSRFWMRAVWCLASTLILALLERESQVLRVEKEIQSQVNRQMDKNQRDYYLREQMKIIAGELDEGEDTPRRGGKLSGKNC